MMMDWITNFVTSTPWNGPLALLLYWLPLALCSVGYVIRTGKDFSKEKSKCHEKHYTPELTIGTLIGRGVAAVFPIVNLLAAIFDVAPELFGSFFKWLGKVFDQPLVPRRYVEPPKEQ